MNNITVPYIDLVAPHAAIKRELLAAVERVLGHGQFILGPEVESFEKAFSSYCKTKHTVGVDNGTNALSLAMRCLDIGPGDEVITAPNSFLASTSAIALIGARPVFVDVGDDYNIDTNLIEAAITDRTRAILPVHLTGRPADMHAIVDIAAKHNLHVIEDCAQAVGASIDGRKVGSFGGVGCFSLHPLKTLSAVGDGGAITTDDDGLYERLIKARNHGLRDRDSCEFWSLNARLDAIQAAMLLVKMEHLDQWTNARRSHADFYARELKGTVQTPADKPHEHSVYHTFVVRAERRDELQSYLKTRGIDSKIHYPIPIHLQMAAKSYGYKEGSFPVTEKQSRQILSLPIYPELTEPQRQHVVDSIKSFYSGTKKG